MIRINLLPVKQVKKVQAGQRQLLIFGLALLAEVAVMIFLYQMQASEVKIRQQRASLLEGEIEQLKKAVADFDKLKKREKQLVAQEKVITDLQKGRTGPVSMMRELSNILTRGKGPTVEQKVYEKKLRENPNAGYNTRWNAERLWLSNIKEVRGLLRIRGVAKDYDDVAEFNKRIHLSQFFVDDFLERNQQVTDKEYQQRLVDFSLRCKVVY